MLKIVTDKTAVFGGLVAKSLVDFRRNLRAQVRRYWAGEDAKGDFVFNFFNAVDRGFNQAFAAGAAECGIRPNEYTNEMKTVLQNKINEQFPYINNLANRIVVKADGGKLGKAMREIEVWIARYGELLNMGKLLACADRKLKWVLGAAEHCPSCVKLSGKVKRASYWKAHGILPRVAGAEYLECKGYNCKCSLEVTSDSLTRGSLPALP